MFSISNCLVFVLNIGFWLRTLVAAVADQVDVIVCDANQFTNRNFRSDHADPATSAVLTILDQILVSANRKRESSKCITYNWEVSTLATEQLAVLEASKLKTSSSDRSWKKAVARATPCGAGAGRELSSTRCLAALCVESI